MTAVYLFAGILLVLLVAVILAPLLERSGPASEGKVRSPRERQEAAIDALREIEFEYHTGKLAEEDYHRLRDRFAKEALAARDEVRGAPGSSRAPGSSEPGTGSDLPAAGAPAGTDAGVEGAPQAASGEAAGPGGCPACGSAARPGARYCTQCGAPLGPGEEEDPHA